MQLDKSNEAQSPAIDEKSLKRLPILFACVFLFYLVSAFFLMIAIRSDNGNPEIVELLARFDVASAHIIFFKYSLIGCVVVPFIFIAEWFCVGWARSSLSALTRNESMSGRSDFVCFVLTHLRLLRIPQVLFTFGLALISGSMVSEFIGRHLFHGFSRLPIPAFIAFPIYFLLYTLFDYLAHRVDHSRYFWPLHRFHHAADDFNVMTADRGHPASAFTQSGLKIFPLALLGVPPDAIIDVGMLIVVINYLNHSRIDWDFGWFGRYVIQSPLHHQLHHSRLLRHPVNLSVCPLWDRLGGTWRDVTTSSIKIGTSVPYRHGGNILPDLLRDYRDFLRGLLWGMQRLWKTAVANKAAKTSGDTAATSGEAASPPIVQLEVPVNADGALQGSD